MSPKAVIINDIHYNLQTLQVADAVLNMAVDKANELKLPLIIAGDLHDTKAVMRAECVNAILKTLDKMNEHTYILRGNHDSLNEKSKDHALTAFVSDKCDVVAHPVYCQELNLYFIPYQSDPSEFVEALDKIPKFSFLIIHQGVYSESSAYNEASAVPLSVFDKYYTVVSGHYHKRQSLNDGRFIYTGAPYTVTFAEADDPEKGYHILMNDNSLQFIPTKVRKHVIYNVTEQNLSSNMSKHNPEDIIWVKYQGSNNSAVITIVGETIGITQGFKLDYVEYDRGDIKIPLTVNESDEQVLDRVIDSSNASLEEKSRLKQLYRQLL